MHPSEIRKVAFVGDYLPRKCGIATFTGDMYASVARRFPDAECFVVPVNDRPEGYDYPPEVRFEIDEPDLESYRRAADFLNFANTDVVSLQHEYGIYGGTAGSHVLGLVRDLRMPVVTTFHTVLKEPNDEQRQVLTELAEVSARVVVMTQLARTFLRTIYGVPDAKIDAMVGLSSTTSTRGLAPPAPAALEGAATAASARIGKAATGTGVTIDGGMAGAGLGAASASSRDTVRSSSSTVVSPCAAFAIPSSNRVRIPHRRAAFFSACSGARSAISARTSSLTFRISWIAMRPL